MSFLYPAFLIGAIAVAIPLVLHLRRRDVAREVPFTAVRLLRGSQLEQTRRRRLRDPLLLAARAAALLLLALAFARPYLVGSDAEHLMHIVAIDRSYSMGADGQFDRALTLARNTIDAAPRGGRVAVVAFDEGAQVVAEPGSAADARAALDALQPGYGSTRYAPLVSRALELTGRGAASLHVIGDMQRAGWEGAQPVAVPAHVRVRLHEVDLPAANAAVTSVRRVDDGVLAVVEHSGGGALSGTARLWLDGRHVAEAPFTLPSPGSVEILLRHALPVRGAAAVEIDDGGGFPADNMRHLVLDAAAPVKVLVLGEDTAQSGFYPSRAFESSDVARAIEVRSSSPGSIGRTSAEDWSSTGAVLLLSTRGLDRRAREALVEFVHRGGGLLVAAAPEVDPAVLASVLDWRGFDAVEQANPAVLAVTDLRHPIFQPFGAMAANLGQVRFNRIWHVRGEGWDVAARFTDGAPALLERRQGEGRILLFASDLDRRWNDFPLHPAFVPFMIESVRHVAARPDRRREYLVAEAPPGAGPGPGVFTLPPDGRRVAVNVDVRESSLVRTADDEFMAMLPQTDAQPRVAAALAAEQIEARQDLWRYGILLMLGLLIAESFIGRSA